MSNSKKLKEILGEKSIVKIGGAFDALSAKLVEVTGYDAIWAGSFAISATHALPDASILTMTDFLKSTENMVDACNIPVIADCDTGFGGPSNVSHTVKKFESAGVAAICIEDKTFPKQNYRDIVNYKNYLFLFWKKLQTISCFFTRGKKQAANWILVQTALCWVGKSLQWIVSEFISLEDVQFILRLCL